MCLFSATQQQVIVQDPKILQHMSNTGMVSVELFFHMLAFGILKYRTVIVLTQVFGYLKFNLLLLHCIDLIV